jgi:hypothetical protein
MSTLSQFVAPTVTTQTVNTTTFSQIQSVQTGFLDARYSYSPAPTFNGANIEDSYIFADINISSVNVSKSFVVSNLKYFFHSTGFAPSISQVLSSTSAQHVSARLTSSTNLRFSVCFAGVPSSQWGFGVGGRWQVISYN